MRYIQGLAVDGVVLRTPSEGDAAAMAALMRRVYDETEFLNRTAAEFAVTDEEEAAFLARIERSPRECMIGAWLDGCLVGNVNVGMVGDCARLRHRAALGIAVVQKAWGRGVGSRLMEAAIQTAASAGYRQIELETAADNVRALRLYERFGFAACGCWPEALRRADGSYVDEVMMVRRLTGEIR